MEALVKKKTTTLRLTIDKQHLVLLHDGELFKGGSAGVLVRFG